MKFEELYLPDTSLESIFIEYDKAVITIYDFDYKCIYKITCTGLAGVTDLNIWDENIIIAASLKPVDMEDEFVRQCKQVYIWDYDTGINRRLSNGLLLLSLTLANNVVFKVYCQNVEAEKCSAENSRFNQQNI